MKEIREIIRLRRALPEKPFALATVVQVEGSSYRRPGARMLIDLNGRVCGSVSGGCLERDVITKALHVILEGKSQILVYDTNDVEDLQLATSLGCQGKITILIEALLPGKSWPLAQAVQEVEVDLHPKILVTLYDGDLRGGNQAFIAAGSGENQWGALPQGVSQEIKKGVNEVGKSGKNVSGCLAFGREMIGWLIEKILSPPCLFIFGGGPDATPLVRLSVELGYRVVVIDRRVELAQRERFPEAESVFHLKPSQILAHLAIPEDAAVILMNHHYETDRDILGLLLARPLAYFGMLGPKKRTLRILGELEDRGLTFSASQKNKFFAPAGLDLGSDYPEQIALSILAEIQAVRGRKSAAHLRSRDLPIHALEELQFPPPHFPQIDPCATSELLF